MCNRTAVYIPPLNNVIARLCRHCDVVVVDEQRPLRQHPGTQEEERAGERVKYKPNKRWAEKTCFTRDE